MKPFETLAQEQSGAVLTVTLNRPDKHNVISQRMRDELLSLFAEVAGDSSVRVIVLTGAGDRSFCAGTDVTEFSGRPGLDQWRRDIAPTRIFEVIERLPKPVIAMVNGCAFGGGCELALACDIRVACEEAQFGQLEINFGLIPGGGGTQRLTRLVGRGQAMRFILSGDRFPAAEALRIGLVDVLCGKAELRQTTMAMAERIAGHSPVALELAKSAIVNVDELSLSAGLRYEAGLMAVGLYAGDQNERIDAFVRNRRGPRKDRAEKPEQH